MLLLYFFCCTALGYPCYERIKLKLTLPFFSVAIHSGKCRTKKKRKKDGAVFREEAASFNATFGPFGGQKR